MRKGELNQVNVLYERSIAFHYEFSCERIIYCILIWYN